MKGNRLVLCCLAMTACLLSAKIARGRGYCLLTAGAGLGGESAAGSFGAEGGWRGRYLLLGAGGSMTFNGGDWETLSANYLMTADRRRNNDLEAYGAVGVALAKNLYLVGTAGSSYGSTGSRTTTDAGTQIVWEPDYEGGRLTWSGQLHYSPGRWILGGGFHNRRGAIARIGVAF